MFPPSTNLKSVSIKKDNTFEVYYQNINLRFSIWDFFRSTLRISKIEADNGYVKLNKFKDNKKQTSSSTPDLFKILNDDILEKLPVQISEFEVSNTDLNYDRYIIPIRSLSFRPYRSSIDLEVEAEYFRFGEYGLDEVSLRAEIQPGKLRVVESELLKGETKLNIIGEYDFKNSRKTNFELKYNGELEDFIPKNIQEIVQINGQCHCKITTSGDLFQNLNVDASGKLSNLETTYANVDEVNFSLNYKNDVISINKVNGNIRGGSFRLNSPISINTTTNKISEIDVSANQLHTHDILYFLGDDFKILQGRVSGNTKIGIDEKLITIKNSNNLKVEKFKLGYKNKLLEHDHLDVSKLEFEIDQDVNFKTAVAVGEEKLEANGVITDKALNIVASSKQLTFQKLGGEIGSIVSGEGDALLRFFGPLDDVKMHIISNEVKDVSILGYSVEDTSSFIAELSFNTNILSIQDFKSWNDGTVSAIGFVDFEKEELELNLDVEKSYFGKLRKALKPVWSTISPYVEGLDGEFRGYSKIYGTFDDVKVDLKATSSKVSQYTEPFNELFLDLYVDSKKVDIRKLIGKKNKGFLEGELIYDYDKGVTKAKALLNNVKLGDLNIYRQLSLGYDGTINFEFDLEKKDKNYIADGEFTIFRSSVGRKKVKPSRISFNLKDENVKFKGIILGGKADFDSSIFIGSKKDQLSNFDANISITDMRTLFGILSLHNIYDTELDGEIEGKLKSTFTINNFDNINVDLKTTKFNISKFNKFITLIKPGILKIEKSKIEKFDYDIRGNGGYLKLSGEGDLRKEIKIEQKFNFDLIFMQLVTPYIERISGNFGGRGVISGPLMKLNNFHELNTEDLFVKIKKVPLSISKGKVKSVLNNTSWTLNSFDANVGDGTLKASGKVNIAVPFPVADLDLIADNITIPVKENSLVNVDSVLKLEGKRFPYKVSGDVVINNGKVEDEFTEFATETGFVKSVNKYVDVSQRGLPEILWLDIKARTLDSIMIKNRLSEIFFVGDIGVTGNPLNPNLKGQLTVIPTLSKFKFKGNEFFINDGAVIFEGNNSATPIVLNFASEAKVNEYDVKMSVVGGVDDLKINLESNPILSKENIFSLLTLGVTSDFSKNLEAKDRESLTRIGLGTLIVDQLKINEGLDSTLGLKLSVLPEVSSGDDSPIEASKAEQTSKVKTATKLKIQKKVSEKVGLTFSNTFGGEGGQKQEMNIDFNINDQFSIQGVFEKSEDNNETNDDGSVGADIKYKWSF